MSVAARVTLAEPGPVLRLRERAVRVRPPHPRPLATKGGEARALVGHGVLGHALAPVGPKLHRADDLADLLVYAERHDRPPVRPARSAVALAVQWILRLSAIGMQRAPAVAAVEHPVQDARRTGALPARPAIVPPTLLDALVEILVDDADMPPGVLVPLVADDPRVEAPGQHVLDGMRREQPAGARREPLRVEPARDRSVGAARSLALERARDGGGLLRDLLRYS